jgi:hypothetical protein
VSGTVELFGIVDANGDGHPHVFSTFAAQRQNPRAAQTRATGRRAIGAGRPARTKPTRQHPSHLAHRRRCESVRGMALDGCGSTAASCHHVAPRYDDKRARPRVTYTDRVRAKNQGRRRTVQRYGPLKPPLENIRGRAEPMNSPRFIVAISRITPPSAAGASGLRFGERPNPKGPTMTSGDSAYHLHPDVGTEDELADDMHAPTSALDDSACSRFRATYFRGDGVGAMVVR